jgi:subtilase family protein
MLLIFEAFIMKYASFVFLLLGFLLGDYSAVASIDSINNPKIDYLCDGNQNLTKLSSDILKIRLAFNKSESAETAFVRYASHAIRNGRLQCIIGAKIISPELIHACTNADLEITGVHQYGNLHQLVVLCYDPNQFDEIVERSDIFGISTEPYAVSFAGSVENEADKILNAEQSRSEFNLSGAGIRIGVLSDSIADRSHTGRMFDGFLLGTSSQMKLDLPRNIKIIDEGDGFGDDEGAAIMELIYDLAPGADFSFAAVRYNYSVFAENIKKLWTDPGYECDLLVDDIGFLQEPVYQHGPIALAAMEAVSNGVPYFTAAGNFGDNGHDRLFEDVSSVDDHSFPPNGNDFHDFGKACGLASDTHLSIHIPHLSSVAITLHWDEPYGGVFAEGIGAESDLDLYLTSDEELPLSENNILASSVNFQGEEYNPSGEPVEVIVFFNEGSDRDVNIVINHQKGRVPRNIHLYVIFNSGNNSNSANQVNDKHLLYDRTLVGHMIAPGVTTVAAIPVKEINHTGDFLDPEEILNVQSYSALGGFLPVFFSDDGLTRLNEPHFILKPDITGPDETSTGVLGFGTFEGTSAAAANIAAVAALMLEAQSSLTPDQLLETMKETALDIEEEGPDAYSGAGLVDAFKAIQSLENTPVHDWPLY